MRKTLLLLSLLTAVAAPACAAGDQRSAMPSPLISDDAGDALVAAGAVGLAVLFLLWQAH
jgi:hypothetical protein